MELNKRFNFFKKLSVLTLIASTLVLLITSFRQISNKNNIEPADLVNPLMGTR